MVSRRKRDVSYHERRRQRVFKLYRLSTKNIDGNTDLRFWYCVKFCKRKKLLSLKPVFAKTCLLTRADMPQLVSSSVSPVHV